MDPHSEVSSSAMTARMKIGALHYIRDFRHQCYDNMINSTRSHVEFLVPVLLTLPEHMPFPNLL